MDLIARLLIGPKAGSITYRGNAGEVDELEVVKGPLGDAIVKVRHDVPRPVPDPDHDDAERDMAACSDAGKRVKSTQVILHISHNISVMNIVENRRGLVSIRDTQPGYPCSSIMCGSPHQGTSISPGRHDGIHGLLLLDAGESRSGVRGASDLKGIIPYVCEMII